jgi:hypothetical protein
MPDGMTIRIDLSEIHALGARLSDLAPALRTETARTMHRVVLEGEARAKRGVSVDTGHYRRSITSDVRVAPRAIIGQFGSNVPYAPVRELGRRPGARMPPPGALRGWMRRHGIPLELEFVLRRRIGRRGTKAEHTFRDTLKDLRPLAEREFMQMKPRLIAALRGRGAP